MFSSNLMAIEKIPKEEALIRKPSNYLYSGFMPAQRIDITSQGMNLYSPTNEQLCSLPVGTQLITNSYLQSGFMNVYLPQDQNFALASAKFALERCRQQLNLKGSKKSSTMEDEVYVGKVEIQKSRTSFSKINYTEGRTVCHSCGQKTKADLIAHKGDIGEIAKNISSNSKSPAKTTHSNNRLSKPVSESCRISSHYGHRTHPISKKKRMHHGTDFACQSSVMAAKDGEILKIVTGCKRGNHSCGGGYGNHVEILHSDGTVTKYAHMQHPSKCSSSQNLRVGTKVSRGEKLGCIGSTGRSTGPHLHFEYIINQRSVNPLDYM